MKVGFLHSQREGLETNLPSNALALPHGFETANLEEHQTAQHCSSPTPPKNNTHIQKTTNTFKSEQLYTIMTQ